MSNKNKDLQYNRRLARKEKFDRLYKPLRDLSERYDRPQEAQESPRKALLFPR